MSRSKLQNDTDGWRPIPDPTVLTTELTLREIAGLKELFQSQTGDLRNSVNRINDHINTRHAEIREESDRIQDLFIEKFKSIDIQFSERDIRQDLIIASGKAAVEAALQSQKESMMKTETAFTKQIDQMQMLINAVAKATDEKIDDLKTRLTLIEGKSKGIGEGWGVIVAAGGLATGILIAVAAYIR